RPSGFSGTSKTPYYYIILLAAVATVSLCYWMSRSKLGYYLQAIREDQETAESIGINTTRFKLFALAISAAITALAGAFYANYFLFVDPTIVLPLSLSIEIVLIGIIGGLGTVWGPVFGAVLLKLSSEVFRSLTAGTKYEQSSLLIYGLLLIVVILFLPDGLVGGLNKLFRRVREGSVAAA
ncbi:MAG TPA: branched-chain amino acid ABC transporter permease, partial [Blastocatellia bacterium]|nr:branched-chain amino acid ABC transporter permease [Blastocatellia bacterium]